MSANESKVTSITPRAPELKFKLFNARLVSKK